VPTDPVTLLEGYKQRHPETVILSPRETQAGLWTARIDGRQVATGLDITRLLEALTRHHGDDLGV
jgi:hypothetical protein